MLQSTLSTNMVALGDDARELLDWLLENSAVEKPSCVFSSKTSEEYPSLSLLVTEGDFNDMRCCVVCCGHYTLPVWPQKIGVTHQR